MRKYCFREHAFGAAEACGVTFVTRDDRITTAAEVCELLGITQEEALRFLSPDEQTEISMSPLAIKTPQLSVEMRMLCLLGYAGAKQRECAGALSGT